MASVISGRNTPATQPARAALRKHRSCRWHAFRRLRSLTCGLGSHRLACHVCKQSTSRWKPRSHAQMLTATGGHHTPSRPCFAAQDLHLEACQQTGEDQAPSQPISAACKPSSCAQRRSATNGQMSGPCLQSDFIQSSALRNPSRGSARGQEACTGRGMLRTCPGRAVLQCCPCRAPWW